MLREDRSICGKRTSSRPYGELGAVEFGFCCCFVCVDSNLGTIMPSFGCDRDAVDAIVRGLNERVKRRGDSAQIKLSERIAAKAAVVEEKMDAISKLLGAMDIHEPPEVFLMDDR